MIWLAACTSAPPGPPVVLISVDTLRADFVYDHAFTETPALDELRAQGTTFERAIAPAPTTLASHTSMMTGRHPHTHGVPYNGTFVPADELLLAERFKAAGWPTGAVVGGFPLDERFGLDQGFDDYTGPWEGAEAVTDVALAWLAENDEGRAFLFVHYWDVHHPWTPPEPWDRMYRDDDLELTPKQSVGEYRKTVTGRAEGWAELNRALQGSYGGAVSYVDHHIGRLVEALPRDATVVVTSDHGETHHEWRFAWSHGATVHDTATRVPLIIRSPQLDPGVRPELVSGVDLAPTLLALAGLPSEGMEGTSLTFPGGRPAWSEATMPHHVRPDGSWPNEGNCRAMWEGPWKLTHCPNFETEAQLSRPPDEHHTIVDPVGETMLNALTRWSKAQPDRVAPSSSDEASLRQLEALGYVVR